MTTSSIDVALPPAHRKVHTWVNHALCILLSLVFLTAAIAKTTAFRELEATLAALMLVPVLLTLQAGVLLVVTEYLVALLLLIPKSLQPDAGARPREGPGFQRAVRGDSYIEIGGVAERRQVQRLAPTTISRAYRRRSLQSHCRSCVCESEIDARCRRAPQSNARRQPESSPHHRRTA